APWTKGLFSEIYLLSDKELKREKPEWIDKMTRLTAVMIELWIRTNQDGLLKDFLSTYDFQFLLNYLKQVAKDDLDRTTFLYLEVLISILYEKDRNLLIPMKRSIY